MDFDYGTTNSYYTSYRRVGAAKGISELLINELVNNGTYTVVDRSKLLTPCQFLLRCRHPSYRCDFAV